MRVGEPFTHQLRVRYAECDPQNVVFNAHYLAYFDVALTELWRAAFGSYQAMVDRGVDLLTLAIAVTQLGNTSIVSDHGISRDGELIVEGTTRHVLVEIEGLTKTTIPDWMRQQLAPWTVERGS